MSTRLRADQSTSCQNQASLITKLKLTQDKIPIKWLKRSRCCWRDEASSLMYVCPSGPAVRLGVKQSAYSDVQLLYHLLWNRRLYSGRAVVLSKMLLLDFCVGCVEQFLVKNLFMHYSLLSCTVDTQAGNTAHTANQSTARYPGIYQKWPLHNVNNGMIVRILTNRHTHIVIPMWLVSDNKTIFGVRFYL